MQKYPPCSTKMVEDTRAPLVAQCGGGPCPGKKRQVVCENLLPSGTGRVAGDGLVCFNPELHSRSHDCSTLEDGLILLFTGFHLIRELERKQVPARQ